MHLTISIYIVLCPAPRFTTMPGTLSTEHIKCIENTRAIMKASCNMYQFDLYISLSIVYCSSIVSNFWEEDEISTGLLINWNHLREALYCKTINFHFIFPWECYHRLSVYLLKVECTVVWSSVGYKIASSPAFPQCHVDTLSVGVNKKWPFLQIHWQALYFTLLHTPKRFLASLMIISANIWFNVSFRHNANVE